MAKHRAIAFTDGAFNSKTNKIGSGIVFHANNVFIEGLPLPGFVCEVSIQIDLTGIKCFKNNIFDAAHTKEQIDLMTRYGSLIGELKAARYALIMSHLLGVKSLNLNYDFTGVKYFSTYDNIKERHKRIPFINYFANLSEVLKKQIYVRFTKIKAHSDNKFNDHADRLARGEV